MFVMSLWCVCDVIAMCLSCHCGVFVISVQCMKLVDFEIGNTNILKKLFLIIMMSKRGCFT